MEPLSFSACTVVRAQPLSTIYESCLREDRPNIAKGPRRATTLAAATVKRREAGGVVPSHNCYFVIGTCYSATGSTQQSRIDKVYHQKSSDDLSDDGCIPYYSICGHIFTRTLNPVLASVISQ